MKQRKVSREANSRTPDQAQGQLLVDKYKCPCSKGLIITEFDPRSRNKQRMTTLQCPHCQEHYVILNETSFNWSLVPRSFVE